MTVGFLLATGLVWAAPPSLAVHDTGQFELDGNIAHNSATAPPYDWASLFDASGNRIVTPDPDNGPVLASVFRSDAAAPDASYFNSNKDTEGVGDWGCGTVNNPTDKDDILNAYAALIHVPAGAPDNANHNVLYLGTERDSNNGDAFAGFWLFKDSNVGCSAGGFTGQHTDGDLLIVSNYSNGGSSQDVTVYRWTGNDATGVLVEQTALDGAVCGGAANDDACAIANTSTITSPWSPTSHPANTFVEAGIDLTALLGANGGCFTSFMAETRTSTSTAATLKDFASGQFNTCPKPPITTTATPGGPAAPGSSQHDEATLAAVGSRPTPTGSVNFYLCAPAAVTAAGCPTGGTHVGGAVSLVGGAASSATINGATDTATGKYCWRAEYTPDAASSGIYLASSHTNAATECFTIAHASPTITTQIAVTGSGPPGLGLTTLGDSATLSGFVPGTVTGETVTFNLYGPYLAGDTIDCAAGKKVFTTTGALSAGGGATASATYDPTAVGTYVWRATYGGNASNDAVTDACNETSEKTTVVGAVIDVSKSANPAGSVSAGDTIGFDIVVTNEGSVPSLGTVVTDNLPAGAGNDLNWSLVPGYPNCSISGAVGSQVLTCTLGRVNGPGSLPVIHVQSPTTQLDCGSVKNKASVSTTNGTGGDSDFATVAVNCANLSLVKTADAATVDAGSQIGFVVTASNSGAAGTGTAHGVVINDPLPNGSGVDWSIVEGPDTCSIQGAVPNQVLHCAAVNLAPGASETVHVVSATAYASCAAYRNVASLTATNASTLEATATTTVQCPSLTLTKTADASSVDAGAQIGFTVTVSNGGPGGATGVVLNDPLPAGAGIDWSIASGPANCSVQGSPPAQTLHCTPVPLTSGGSETVHVVSGTAFSSCTSYSNTATATATNSPAPNPATAETTVACAALTLTKTADAATVNAGSQIGFTVIASNTGTGTARGVVIDDPLPLNSGIEWTLDAGPADCSITTVTGPPRTQTLHCTAFDLAPGHTLTVHVTSSTGYASCAALPNTASLTATNHPSATAAATTTVQCPKLSLTKTADAASVSAGSPVGFTLAIGNVGPGTAMTATLSDVLPAGMGIDWSVSPAYSGPGTCTIGGAVGSQVLTCSFGDLGAGASASVHVTSATSLVSCATLPNSATLAATNAPDVVASASTTVKCPHISLTKTADAATVDAGDQIGFTITASNSAAAGTGTASGVVIDDALPNGTGVEWLISSGPDNCSIQGAVPAQSLHCTAVDLAPGASQTVHVISATAYASCAAYKNVASLTATNASALDASATTTVQCPSLTLTKTADDTTVDAGEQIGFTVVVSNAGPGGATGVVLDDPLPGGTGIDWSISSGPADCSIQGSPAAQTLHCTAVPLASGGNESVHVVSSTAFASCASYANTVTLTGGNHPSMTAHATTTVACAALELTKTADAATVNAGSQIGFTVTATNTSAAGTAHDVVIDDPLPLGTGIDWTLASGSANCAITGTAPTQTLHCIAADLGPGASVTAHVTSPTQYASCAALPNTAGLTSSNHPSRSASATTTVQCPTLSLTKVADAATVSAGTSVGFTLTVGNAGPGTATDATLSDALPAGAGIDWSIDPAYAGPGDCAITGAVGSQVLDCAFGDLASGDSATVHVTSTTSSTSCATLPNSATLSAANAPDVIEGASTTVQCPDVSLVKTADAATVDAGSKIGFTVTVSNNAAAGTGTATGVVIDDPLPSGSGVDWQLDSGPDTCTITGTAPTQTLHCDAVDLAPGASEAVHITSDTAFAACGTYDNTADVTLTNGSAPGPAEASTTVQCPSLTLTKTADNDTVAAEGQIGFTVSVANAGPGTATDVVLVDPLPKGDEGVSWSIDADATSATGCTVDEVDGTQVLTCALGDLLSGAVATVHLISPTMSTSCGDYVNTATLDAGNAPQLTATATTTVTDCLGILPEPPVHRTPTPPAPTPPASTGPLAVTGAGPLGGELALVLLLLAAGGVLLLVARPRRRSRHTH